MHSNKQIRQLAASMRRFGVTAPILIDENNTVFPRHGRLLAAKHLELKSLPLSTVSRPERCRETRSYVLADNRLVLNGTWDEEILAGELKGLLADDFDIGVTGFSLPEIDTLVEGLVPEEPGAPEDDILPPDVPKRCRSATSGRWGDLA